MNKTDLVNSLSVRGGITLVKSREIFGALFGIIEAGLGEGKNVLLSDFGSFRVHRRKAFKGSNPKTQKPLQVGVRYIVTFRPGKKMKQVLNPDYKK